MKTKAHYYMFLISSFMFLLLGCETTSRQAPSNLQKTEVPGAFYSLERDESLRDVKWISFINQTPEWVSFFLQTGDSPGNLSLEYLAAQGMLQRISFPVGAYQKYPRANNFNSPYYWVWARRGRWKVAADAIVPD